MATSVPHGSLSASEIQRALQRYSTEDLQHEVDRRLREELREHREATARIEQRLGIGHSNGTHATRDERLANALQFEARATRVPLSPTQMILDLLEARSMEIAELTSEMLRAGWTTRSPTPKSIIRQYVTRLVEQGRVKPLASGAYRLLKTRQPPTTKKKSPASPKGQAGLEAAGGKDAASS